MIEFDPRPFMNDVEFRLYDELRTLRGQRDSAMQKAGRMARTALQAESFAVYQHGGHFHAVRVLDVSPYGHTGSANVEVRYMSSGSVGWMDSDRLVGPFGSLTAARNFCSAARDLYCERYA